MQVPIGADVVPTFGIISWIIIGGIAGVLAGFAIRGSGMSIVGDSLVGSIGGLIGGFFAHYEHLDGFLEAVGFAFLGALALLLVVRFFTQGGADA